MTTNKRIREMAQLGKLLKYEDLSPSQNLHKNLGIVAHLQSHN